MVRSSSPNGPRSHFRSLNTAPIISGANIPLPLALPLRPTAQELHLLPREPQNVNLLFVITRFYRCVNKPTTIRRPEGAPIVALSKNRRWKPKTPTIANSHLRNSPIQLVSGMFSRDPKAAGFKACDHNPYELDFRVAKCYH
jgi:hypothetical protein